MFFYNELKPLLHKISSNSEDLSSVQLSHKKITDKNLLQISDALQTNSHVDEIWLTNNFITEVGSLTGVLEKNESVAEVYLGGNKIGDQGASCIAALIRKNTTITDMGIEENNITDTGANIIADALSHNESLQTLKLNGNNIDSFDTMIAINEKLKQNKENAMKKLYEEHPEYVMQKIKKLKKKKSKKSKSDKDRREKSDNHSRPKSSDDGKSKSAEKETENDDECSIADKFLEERKKSIEGNSVADKLKSGLKIGSKSTGQSTNAPKGTFT